MTGKLLLAIALLLTTMASKADDQKVDSKVQKVVVFLNGAQVTRTAMVNINPGTTTLSFGNISPNIDVQSIQVHANGNFTILSVKHEMDYLNEQAQQKRLEDIRAQQKIIKDKIDLEQNYISVYEEAANMLRKNQEVSGQNTGLDIVKLKQAIDFQTEQLTEIKKKEQAVNNEIATLNLELQKYSKQIADITKGSSKATSDILVTVSSKAALQTEFSVNYVVHNASWFPTYDIRAKNVNSPISISYKANVSQQSGEDWKNIRLTLSTGNPTVSGNKPEMSPYYLNFGMIYSAETGKITRVTGRLVGSDDNMPIIGATVKVKGTSIGTVTDVNGNYSIQVPEGNPVLVYNFVGYESAERSTYASVVNVALKPMANELNEVVTVGYGIQGSASGVSVERKRDITGSVTTIPIVVNSVENQTNVEFDIANPYSIPSDGKQYAVDINQFDLDATYQYAVAPKLSTDVFLTAKITDWNKYNFLSGEANLFFEGTFIGKSLINTNATTDTLNLSLGTDKNIVVTRKSLKDLTEKQSFGSNKKETRYWQIDVKNRKSQQVNLLVEDQVPVSQNSSIDVETQEISGGQLDKNTGKVSWSFLLKPQDEKKVELKYLVKYPKNQSVIVQ
ncbi:MAG: mucoidy inhibitor MuiA family protein [Mucilaginibacter sp.]